MQILIAFYSLYGHVYRLAQAVAEGAEQAGASPLVRFVEETLPEDVLKKMHAAPAEQRGAHLPTASVADMENSGAIILGSPTRFGGMCAQMRAFMDRAGGLWAQQKLKGKVGSAFTSTSTQHGGQETTILSFHTFFLHHGMLIGGIPFDEPGLHGLKEVSGGTPYGAGTITDGKSFPTESELQIARTQGAFIARCALKLGS